MWKGKEVSQGQEDISQPNGHIPSSQFAAHSKIHLYQIPLDLASKYTNIRDVEKNGSLSEGSLPSESDNKKSESNSNNGSEFHGSTAP